MEKLIAENKSLIHLNEMLQSELEQKNEALEKTQASYISLKYQYEELLRRLTDLRLENRSAGSPPVSPKKDASFINVNSEIDELRNKIKRKVEKNDILKNRVSHLETEINRLKNKADSEVSVDTLYNMVYEECSKVFENHNNFIYNKSQYIIDMFRQCIQGVVDYNNLKIEHNNLQKKHKSVLKGCNKLAKKSKQIRRKLIEDKHKRENEEIDDLIRNEVEAISRMIKKHGIGMDFNENEQHKY